LGSIGWIARKVLIAAITLVGPPPSFGQTTGATASAEATVYNTWQLDALLTPIALYPDVLPGAEI
jgi:hypothetical protein